MNRIQKFLLIISLLCASFTVETPLWATWRSSGTEMQGEFAGFAKLILLDKGLVTKMVSEEFDNRIVPAGGIIPKEDVHPVVVIMGAQFNVGAKVFNRYRFPDELKQYNEALIMVPFLLDRSSRGQSYFYSFWRIYVDSQGVVNLAAKVNRSPKVFAEIRNAQEHYTVFSAGRVIIDADLEIRYRDPLTREGLSFLREIFAQRKIEATNRGLNVFEFDFIRSVKTLLPASVSFNNFLGFEFRELGSSLNDCVYFESKWRKIPLD